MRVMLLTAKNMTRTCCVCLCLSERDNTLKLIDKFEEKRGGMLRTLPDDAIPLTMQRKTMIHATSKLMTIHQFRDPRSSTEGEMFRVSLYQK